MTRLRQALLVALWAFVVGGAAGCSGCLGDGTCEPACAFGEICIQGECAVSLACLECAPGQECSDGVCRWRHELCADAGQQCDAWRVQPAGFSCVDWDGPRGEAAVCSKSCAKFACEAGEACFQLGSDRDRACQGDDQCGEHERCSQGRCRALACRPAECEGASEGIDTCAELYADAPGFAHGVACYEFGDGANYCYPAGRQHVGQACVAPMDALATSDFEQTCAQGLACVDGVCRRMCESDATCSGGADGSDDDVAVCVGTRQNSAGESVGFCGRACTPFVVGSCGDGQMCHPLGAGEGDCRPVGARQAFERCEPGVDECADGLLCVHHQRGRGPAAEGRCHPICNVTARDRDATCAPLDEPPAHVALLNLAREVGAVDVYLDDAATPLVAGWSFEQAHPGEGGAEYMALAPGRYDVVIRRAGAPATDRALAEWRALVETGKVQVWSLIPERLGTRASISMRAFELSDAFERPQREGIALVIAHALAELGPVDILALAPDAAWSSDAEGVYLARDLRFGQVAGEGSREALAALAGDVGRLRLVVFDADEPERGPQGARFVYDGIALEQESEGGAGGTPIVFLRGTLDPDDLDTTTDVTRIVRRVPQDAAASTPDLTCIDAGNGVFGYCQQRCAGPDDYGHGRCEGEALGCRPIFRDDAARWEHLCAPVGTARAGSFCDPWSEQSGCAEGLYCLEYGNASDIYRMSNMRGLCTAYCVVDEPGHPRLQCAHPRACRPIDPASGFELGECAQPCEPDEALADLQCPAGQQACRPWASLHGLGAGAGVAPQVHDEQPFCAASGTIAVGAPCPGVDCVPGSECLYPRSRHTGFVASMLSPYFGAAGLSPVCMAHCNPFDAPGGSAPRCAPGETCLFNYPWSAEVGHCAPIHERRRIGERCDFPGLACGEDAICVHDGHEAACMRFCQYRGGGPDGDYERSTCPFDFQCVPLVNDIGYCVNAG